MNHIDGVSDMMLPLCGFVCGSAQKRDNGCCQATRVLSRMKLSPGTCPDARHFSVSLYVTGALLAAALVLEPRGSEFAYVLSPLWTLQEEMPENPSVSSTAPTSTSF